jgi:SP family sugar:H+ symporter-like MFS transporter
VIAPAYISEISPRHVRGRLASLQQLAITTGIFAALLSDAMFATSAGGADQHLWLGIEAWRWMFLAAAVPAVVYGWIAYRLPESPRFLLFKGKEEEARRVFETIAPDEDTDRSIREIQSAIEEDRLAGQKGSLRGKVLGLQAVVWIGITLSVLQQFVGINVIFYYSTTLWKAVGFHEKDSLTISVATSITNILVTLVAIALVDRIGRRPILLAGSIGMAVSLGAMALAFSAATGSGSDISLPGPCCFGGGKRLCGELRRFVGPARLGAAGRDFPVEDPGPCLGSGRGRPVDRQLRHHLELSGNGGCVLAADIRHVRPVRCGVVLLCHVQSARN